MSLQKTLFIIRHSKTEHGFGKKDIDRNLTDQGQLDADLMSKFLHKKNYNIDMLLISAANRTQQSAAYYIQNLNLNPNQFEVRKELYSASANTLIDTVLTTDDSISSLAILAHNPGVSDFLIQFGNGYFDSLATSGVGIFEFNNPWSRFLQSEKKLKEVLSVKHLR